MPEISIINTKSANFHSVKKAIDLYNPGTLVTSSQQEIKNSKGIIIPGVSSTDTVLQNLTQLKLDKVILDFYNSGKPILCICVGMQILFERLEEGQIEGLGIIKGKVKKIPKKNSNNKEFKVPHMGWNQVEIVKKDKIFHDIKDNSEFYFVHSYYCVPEDKNLIISSTEYSLSMCSGIKINNLYAFQFHPEKSSLDGLKIYKNFSEIVSGYK